MQFSAYEIMVTVGEESGLEKRGAEGWVKVRLIGECVSDYDWVQIRVAMRRTRERRAAT